MREEGKRKRNTEERLGQARRQSDRKFSQNYKKRKVMGKEIYQNHVKF